MAQYTETRDDLIPDPEGYFRRFVPAQDRLLTELAAGAEKADIPIIGPVVGELLFLLAQMAGARRILELGTATGYSAIYLGRACQATGGHLITLESLPEMAEQARQNLEKAGLSAFVEVRQGEGLTQMAALTAPFDLIFMDIDKEFYRNALPQCERLLRKGGILLADNTRFKAADPFNQAIFQSPHWRLVNLLCFLPFHSPENDGLCLAMRL